MSRGRPALATVCIFDICVDPEDLRSADTHDFTRLRDNIRDHGLMNRPYVREMSDGQYSLMDGFHRLMALRSLGHIEVQVIVWRS